MIKRIWSRTIAIARKIEGRLTPTLAHRHWVERWVRHGGERELDVLELLVDPKRGALDVGANGGVYTSRPAALVCEVWAIEPNPELCSILRRARYKNVSVVEAAISSHSGFANLSIPIRADGVLSLPCATLEPVGVKYAAKEIRVRLITLDEFADRPIGFVKIDIEGHEFAALQGARILISKHRPNIVIEIENDNGVERVAQIVEYFTTMEFLGYFLTDSEVLPIESLSPGMQDRSLLDKKIPRRESQFVNNFIFLPGEVAPTILGRLASSLRRD